MVPKGYQNEAQTFQKGSKRDNVPKGGPILAQWRPNHKKTRKSGAQWTPKSINKLLKIDKKEMLNMRPNNNAKIIEI